MTETELPLSIVSMKFQFCYKRQENNVGFQHKSVALKTIAAEPNTDFPSRYPVRLHEKYMDLRYSFQTTLSHFFRNFKYLFLGNNIKTVIMRC